MHYYLELQQEDFKARGSTKGDRFVYKILDCDWTTKDIKKYTIDWVAQPCKKGDVYVIMSYLPHGAKGPLTGTQRIMLPQFVGIQDNYDNLEVIEGGIQAKLVNAY